uniref:Uncharacterized protein n=1 Tax=Tanacetum cinerariifolium TaxID=118510 RepID=A0A699Q6T8_TANCI|nr:hypothetical protein [Tanacetum cinerariifolium]
MYIRSKSKGESNHRSAYCGAEVLASSVLRLGLRGLSMANRELPLIDLHKLSRLNISERIGDMLAWLALGPERQPDDAAGAPKATEDAPTIHEGALVNPTPIQVPKPPPTVPRTMP